MNLLDIVGILGDILLTHHLFEECESERRAPAAGPGARAGEKGDRAEARARAMRRLGPEPVLEAISRMLASCGSRETDRQDV